MGRKKSTFMSMVSTIENFLFSFFILVLIGCSHSGGSPEIIFNEFPNDTYQKVVAYKMDGRGSSVVENGLLSEHIVDKGELLSIAESEELIQIFYESSTYGGNPAKCFEPHVGYVFYNLENEIVAHATLCLMCNWMTTTPDIGAFVFSKLGKNNLARLEKKIFME